VKAVASSGALALLVSLLVCLLACSGDEAGTIASATPNAIASENSKPGSPREAWDIVGTNRPGIAGFATEMSVRPGEQIHFKVRSPSPRYLIDIYRVGYYGGDGARKLDSFEPSRVGPQPPCLFTPERGLVDCSTWFESATWRVPDDAVSGVYLAKLTRLDIASDNSNHILFVVREASPRADLLFQTSDTTWQAYNSWADSPERRHSLYRGPDGDGKSRAVKVSYNRPLRIGKSKRHPAQHFLDGRHGFFAAEYPMIRFLERNGYDVGYQSGADTARSGEDLLRHRVFLSVGHDEYWSAEQRANIEEARDAGVHLAFVSGNSVFYKIRWEDDHRTAVCYKRAAPKSHELAGVWTGEWGDPGARGIVPENALTGTGGVRLSDMALEVPAALGRFRFWRGTDFADLPPGGVGSSIENLVGYEWSGDVPNRFRPAGLIRLSHTQSKPPRRAKAAGYGRPAHRAVPSHQMTLYRDAQSRALVFSAGTIQWSFGLDGPDPTHRFIKRGKSDVPADRNIQQAMVNLLSDMGVSARTLQADLVQTGPSDDVLPPRASFAQTAYAGELGQTLVVAGDASDEGGVVAGVEVEVNGVWRRAMGLETWEYNLNPRQAGSSSIRVRSVDDSGNIGSAEAASIEVTAASAP
jgi:hypothetical protein